MTAAAGWPPLFTQADLDAAVRDAVAQEQVRSLAAVTRKNTELAMANTMRRHWEHIAVSREADQARADRALTVLARPLPRRLGAARARLNLINSILKENQ